MTSPEFGGIQPRPEFDPEKPTEIFTYALSLWKWNKDTFKSEVAAEENSILVDELNGYLHSKFGKLQEGLPDVTVKADKIYHTLSIVSPIDGVDVIENGEMPLQGDDNILGSHNLHGTLQRFYISPSNDLRVYVSGSAEPEYLDGGIYIPFLSVPVEGSDIELSAYTTAQKVKEMEEYIYSECKNYGEDVVGLVKLWRSLMKAPNETITRKLQNSSFAIGEIAKNDETSAEFVDALLEIMNLRFGLEAPHGISVKSYRIRNSAGFTIAGQEVFENVTPGLKLMGDSLVRKKIGLTFQHDKGLIEIPADDIEAIYKSK